MTPNEIKDTLKSKNPTSFVEDHLFDCIPAVFMGNRAAYVSWKRDLAKNLEVDPACILVVGSAATGFSLNPSKNFKSFDENSDIDVAIISSHHFNAAWRYLRMEKTRWLRIDERTRIAWKEHMTRYVYWGTIATDRLLGVLPFGEQWLQACTKAAEKDPTKNREINLRLYSDYDALRAYQLNGVRLMRNKIEGIE